jgi:hypothetical protein
MALVFRMIADFVVVAARRCRPWIALRQARVAVVTRTAEKPPKKNYMINNSNLRLWATSMFVAAIGLLTVVQLRVRAAAGAQGDPSTQGAWSDVGYPLVGEGAPLSPVHMSVLPNGNI